MAQYDVKFCYGSGNTEHVEATVEAESAILALRAVLQDNGFRVEYHYPLRMESNVARYDESGECLGVYKVWSAGLTFSGQRAWIYKRIARG